MGGMHLESFCWSPDSVIMHLRQVALPCFTLALLVCKEKDISGERIINKRKEKKRKGRKWKENCFNVWLK